MSRNAFHLGVIIKFKDSNTKQYVKEAFTPLAKYISRSEPDTISYEWLDSDKDPLQVFILERYKSKLSYENIHRHSKYFLMFREKLQSKVSSGDVSLSGHSYIESNIGFV